MLIDWENEDSSSVVQGVKVNDGCYCVGEVSIVKIGGRIHEGKIVAAGKLVQETHTNIHTYMDT